MTVIWVISSIQTFDDKRVDDKKQHEDDDGDGGHYQTCGEIRNYYYFKKQVIEL